MAEITISQFTNAPTHAQGDEFLFQRGTAYYKIEVTRMLGGLLRVTATISQSALQSGNTTPIVLLAAQGVGTYISANEVEGFLDHNGVTYGAATTARIHNSGASNFILESSASFIGAASDRREKFLPDRSSAANFRIFENTSLVLSLNANATGAGGTLYIDALLRIVRFG